MGYHGDFWNAGRDFRDVFGDISPWNGTGNCLDGIVGRYGFMVGLFWFILVYGDVWDMIYMMVCMWVVVGWSGWLCDDMG